MNRLLLNRYAIGAVGALAVVAGVWLYGQTQYRKGFNEARAEAELAAVAIEQGMIYEQQQADARYRGVVLARQELENDLAAMRTRVNGLLQELRHARDSNASGGPHDPGADWIGIFASCYAEYTELGGDAARLADKLGALQDYIRVINEASSR